MLLLECNRGRLSENLLDEEELNVPFEDLTKAELLLFIVVGLTLG